jgi:hydroxyacylglutathione hydrolase
MRNVPCAGHAQCGGFAKGFIPNSVNIGLDSNFAMWVGEMITDIKQEILLVTDTLARRRRASSAEPRGLRQHRSVHLNGGFDAWKNAGKEVDTV